MMADSISTPSAQEVSTDVVPENPNNQQVQGTTVPQTAETPEAVSPQNPAPSHTIQLHILNASGALDQLVADIQSVFDDISKKVTAKLPVSGVDVVVAQNPAGAIPETGIGGRTYTPSLVFLSLNAKSAEFRKYFPTNVQRSLVHEFHHCARFFYVKQTTLLDAIISEGLADHFMGEILGESPNPWSVALSKKQIPEYLGKAKPYLHNSSYDHRAWFFGSGKDIPRWAGYSLGFYLVGKYFKKHTGENAASAFKKPAQNFL